MKKILGLDIGTNSIGGALIELPKTLNEYGKDGKILWTGSRIIPIDGDYLQKFESGGQVETKAAARRIKRGSRRLKQRYVLRRTRLIKVLKILGWINNTFPENFKKKLQDDIDFKFNISSYLPFDKSTIEEATKLLGVKNKDGRLAVSEDWIIYYLRMKALKHKISLKELARILYMFNQRRGFKSGRKDLKNAEENIIEKKWVEILTIESVSEKLNSDKSKDGKTVFEIKAGKYNWEVKRKNKPDWKGKSYTLLFTEKNGKLLQPKVPSEDDWEMTMVALDNQIENSGKHVGEFFFNKLVNDKNYKIRQQVVKRSRYKKELEAIWEMQLKFHPELSDRSKLSEISKELYKANTAKQKEILDKDLINVISNDIIYYQRDLKSQKNLISGCRYEKLKYTKNGEKKIIGVKVAPVSSPEFQEFRIWQDIQNIRIIANEKLVTGKNQINVDVTNEFLTNEIKEVLFNLFDSSNEVTSQNIFNKINKNFLSDSTHKINLFVNRTSLKGNETKEVFRKIFKNNDYKEEGEKILSDKEKFYRLWHIIYSITSTDLEKSEKGIKSALSNPENGFNLLNDKIITEFSKLPELKKDYKSLSSKAINKLLEVMKCGNLWSKEQLNIQTLKRIEKIIAGEFDADIDNYTGDNIIKFFKKERNKKLEELTIEDFQGLPVWLACYVVYGKHSERQVTKKYESFKDIDVMKLIPNNSLRNPIVEKVVRETIHLVKDIWENYGRPDEIHIELGRDLKKNSDERKKISEINVENRNEKERIKKLLYELLNVTFEEYIDTETSVTTEFEVKPNPESPMDIEKFRIWKSCSGTNNEELNLLFGKGNKERIPNKTEINKYTLWLSQKCISPYTGKIIQLSKLFTNEYSVEHIIPRSKLKYDSIDNLVICESAINPEPYKGNKLARLFIRENSGKTLQINGVEYTIFKEEDYFQHCNNIFKGNRSKLRNLLCEEIPDGFITRQLNDTRFISKKLNELLYPIANEKEGLIFTIGSITSELKQNWKLNEVWKEILRPRFERLEKKMEKKFIFQDEENPEKFHFNVSEDPKFELKRIDHRHHALDALIIAATTREHIRYLSSLNAVDNDEELLNVKRKLVKGKIRDFIYPWPGFIKNVNESLQGTIVTFKSSNRVISKPKNKYLKWVKKNGEWKKEFVNQLPNNKWMAVRKSMFKEPQGIIFLKEVKEVGIMDSVKIQIERMKVQDTPSMKTASYVYDKDIREKLKEVIVKTNENITEIKKHLTKNPLKDFNGNEIKKVRVAVFKEYASKRDTINKSFTSKKINNNIPYSHKSPIAELLRFHLKEYNDKPNEAFEGEGLEKLNEKAKTNPKIGKPIVKITRYEEKDPQSKFKNKYVEVDAGSIVYFVMSENEKTKVREEMYSLAVHQVIEKIVQGKPIAEKREGFRTIILSPNDLVYVPTEEELKNVNPIDWSDKKKVVMRIYKMVKSTGNQCYFIPNYISKLIIPYSEGKGEFGSQNCTERTIDTDQTIKNCCIRLTVDRLGNFNPIL